MKKRALFLFIITAAVSLTADHAYSSLNYSYMKDNVNPGKHVTEQATFGGGCFWCIEAIFSRVRGVHSATSGFAGGHLSNPTYEQVVTGNTGHAEVVQVVFDPAEISYVQLLEIFFSVHDPTTLNRQGADVGTQYRSAIFYHSEKQKDTARQIIDRLEKEKIWNDPIVTEVSQLDQFYAASEHHQNYFEKNPYQGYCQMVILPKVEKFKKMFEEFLAD